MSTRYRTLALLGLLWLPLAVLTLVDGTLVGDAVSHPFLKDLVPQVRLLVALPLLVLARFVIDPGVDSVVRNLAGSGVVRDERGFRDALAELEKSRDAVSPDLVMLALAFLLSWLLHPGYDAVVGDTASTSWRWSAVDGHSELTWAGNWYAFVSGPFFQFLLYRWLWRFLIWGRFVFRVSRMPLKLQPTHPDLVGGMGVLAREQQTFTVVFVAFATVVSSAVAHNILVNGATFHDSRPEIIAFVLICVIVIYAPLLFFAGDMYRARRTALGQYGALGQELSGAFYAKWIDNASPDAGAELEGSGDPSTVADYGSVFDTVRSMRIIPVFGRGALSVTVAIALPFAPLYLTEVSLTDLLQRLADALV